MNVTQAVAQRVSIRAFKPDPVSGALVREILEAAARAPSGGNLQPQCSVWRQSRGLAGWRTGHQSSARLFSLHYVI